jgi:hypothetical protein
MLNLQGVIVYLVNYFSKGLLGIKICDLFPVAVSLFNVLFVFIHYSYSFNSYIEVVFLSNHFLIMDLY